MQLTSKTRQLGERAPLLVTSQRQSVEVVVLRELSLKLFTTPTLPSSPPRPAPPCPSPVANGPQQHHRSEREPDSHCQGRIGRDTRETKYQPDRPTDRPTNLPTEERAANKQIKMATKYAFTKTLKEVRFLFCQTSEHSAATRYVESPGGVRLWPLHLDVSCPSARAQQPYSSRVIPICRIATNSDHRIPPLPRPPNLSPKETNGRWKRRDCYAGGGPPGGGGEAVDSRHMRTIPTKKTQK